MSARYPSPSATTKTTTMMIVSVPIMLMAMTRSEILGPSTQRTRHKSASTTSTTMVTVLST